MKTSFLKRIVICLLLFVILPPSLVLANDTEELTIESPSAILIDMSSGKVLFEKNSNKRMYPASLTKILTAILVLENCKLDEIANVSSNAVMSVSARLCFC